MRWYTPPPPFPVLHLQGGGPTGGSHQGRHTTEDGPGMQSILERNDLDEIMAMVGHAAETHIAEH